MNKWQEKTIKALMNRGYDPLTASKLYERAYKKLTSKVISSGFDRSYETYMSLVNESNFIRFDIKNNRLFYVDTGIDVSSGNFEREYTKSRLSAFSNKYEIVQDYIEQYDRGEISLKELNEKIKRFKKDNQEYHKEGS